MPKSASKVIRKAGDSETLARAWHLANLDARDDFIPDAWGHSDFALNLPANLEAIARRLRTRTYRPHPLLHLDIPKSSLSVRPGSIVDIEDKVALWAILVAAGRTLDNAIPPNVYSYRVRDKFNEDHFFVKRDLLDFPFLRSATILNHIAEFEPWFYAWLEFTAETFRQLRSKGFTRLVTSDISSYFENIDLEVLRSQLSKHLPKDHDTANLLVDILSAWTWPAYSGAPAPRGIPQGNDVSGFIGSFYLNPIDSSILQLARTDKIHYARYVDDIVILTTNRSTALAVLLELTHGLRQLRLTVQGAKTKVIEGQVRIRERLVDARLERVSKIVDKIGGPRRPKLSQAQGLLRQLRTAAEPLHKTDGAYADRDLRVFRRMITGFAILGDAGLVRSVTTQISTGSDSRMLQSAIRYFRSLAKTTPIMAHRLVRILESQTMFPYQRACILGMLRELGQDPSGMRRIAVEELRKNPEWYVRHEAARLLSLLPLSDREVDGIWGRFEKEPNPTVQRAIATCLVQLGVADLRTLTENLVHSPEPALHRLGAYFLFMTTKDEPVRSKARDLFRNLDERKFLSRPHEFELIGKSGIKAVRQDLSRRMNSYTLNLRRPVLVARWNRLAHYVGKSVRAESSTS